VSIDHGFGLAGRAGGEQELGDAVCADRGPGSAHVGIVLGGEQLGKQGGLAVAERIAGDHKFDVVRHGRVKRARKRRAVIGEYQARRQQFDDHAQFAEVARQQRIGRRDRRIGHADIHRRQRQQRVLDTVAGNDDDGPFRGQSTPQQRRADPPHILQHLRITELAPAAVGVALRQEHAIWRRFRPMLQWFGERAMIGRQHLGGAHMDDAIGLAFEHDIGHAQPHRPQRRRPLELFHRVCHYGRVTFGARFSRKSLSRSLACGSAWAMADISASTA